MSDHLKYKPSTGHLVYGPTGHLVYDCAAASACCDIYTYTFDDGGSDIILSFQMSTSLGGTDPNIWWMLDPFAISPTTDGSRGTISKSGTTWTMNVTDSDDGYIFTKTAPDSSCPPVYTAWSSEGVTFTAGGSSGCP